MNKWIVSGALLLWAPPALAQYPTPAGTRPVPGPSIGGVPSTMYRCPNGSYASIYGCPGGAGAPQGSSALEMIGGILQILPQLFPDSTTTAPPPQVPQYYATPAAPPAASQSSSNIPLSNQLAAEQAATSRPPTSYADPFSSRATSANTARPASTAQPSPVIPLSKQLGSGQTAAAAAPSTYADPFASKAASTPAKAPAASTVTFSNDQVRKCATIEGPIVSQTAPLLQICEVAYGNRGANGATAVASSTPSATANRSVSAGPLFQSNSVATLPQTPAPSGSPSVTAGAAPVASYQPPLSTFGPPAAGNGTASIAKPTTYNDPFASPTGIISPTGSTQTASVPEFPGTWRPPTTSASAYANALADWLKQHEAPLVANIEQRNAMGLNYAFSNPEFQNAVAAVLASPAMNKIIPANLVSRVQSQIIQAIAGSILDAKEIASGSHYMGLLHLTNTVSSAVLGVLEPWGGNAANALNISGSFTTAYVYGFFWGK